MLFGAVKKIPLFAFATASENLAQRSLCLAKTEPSPDKSAYRNVRSYYATFREARLSGVRHSHGLLAAPIARSSFTSIHCCGSLPATRVRALALAHNLFPSTQT